MVVFLEPLDADDTPLRQARRPVVRLGERGIEPPALAVTSGDSIGVENATGIYHRPFSTSESNPFNLGTLRGGETRSVELVSPGVVRIYCSLHPSERAVVFVTPSSHFVTFLPPAGYEIRNVPSGRYRLHAWSEGTPAATRTLTVPSGKAVTAEISPPATSE
jgi:plastocyanin